MSEFYTNVNQKGNYIYVKGYNDNGKSFKRKVKYKPYLFMSSNDGKDTPYRTIKGERVNKIEFDDISDARSFINRYQNVSGVTLYGMTDFKFVYIYDTYKGNVDFNYGFLNVISIDIENDSEGGFADIEEADREINAITLSKKGKTITFGFHPYDDVNEDRQYIQCIDEKDLLNKFLHYWNTKEWMPDIITGWNNNGFDNIYIVNRIRRELGEEAVEKLSPFRIVESRKVTRKDGRKIDTYTFFGISTLDYFEIYKKFAMNERESYKLDYIASYELGERKVDYSEYGSLAELYKRNPQLYYTYNIHDSVLIDKFEDKLHYIEQAVTMAYLIKVNHDNVITTVKPWDVLIHNYLMDRGIVIPFFQESDDESQIIGGFVKEPIPGLYSYVMSLDFTSLYPSLVMMFNISPDKFIRKINQPINPEEIISGDISKFTKELDRKNYAMTANGCLFKRDSQGFIPAIMEYFFDERKRFRKLEAAAKKEYEEDKKNETKRNLFLKYKNIQTAFKLLNNSGYGAIANRYMRWFANPLAEGITSSGQLASKYVAHHLNIWLNEQFKSNQVVDYIVYQDTDSAYINLEKLVRVNNIPDGIEAIKFCEEWTKENIQPEVDRICQQLADKLNAFENKIEMKLEKICDKAFFIRKKRYALNVVFDEGLYNKEAKLKVTGLETVRSSVPKVSRSVMEEIFKLIFKNERETIHKRILDFKKEFFTMSFDQIGAPISCNGIDDHFDPVNLYIKGTPVQVKGAIFYNKMLKDHGLDKKYEPIYDHDKVKFCYLLKENPTHQQVISVKGDIPKEIALDKYIDYERMWEKTFIKPIQTICDHIGFSTKETPDLNDLF